MPILPTPILFPISQNMTCYLFFTLFFLFHLSSDSFGLPNEHNVRWNSSILRDSSREQAWFEAAVAIESLQDGHSLVAVDRKQFPHSTSVPAVYKVSQSGEVVWSVESRLVSGSPFAMVLNEMFDLAYIVVLSSKSSSSEVQGHVLRFSGISSNGNSDEIGSKVSEALLFTIDSIQGGTKLFDCAINSFNGDVYVTGGTSGALYGESRGKGDVIVVRLASSGEVVKAIQFGSHEEEFGRAIDISENGSEIVVAVQRGLEGGGSEALMYRLNAESLEISNGPQMLVEQGATPLFTVNDIAIGPPAQDGSVTTFMTGKALAIPDRDVDLFMHVFAVLKNDVANVPIYVDGTSNGKGVDQGVSVRASPDGNAYCIGSSEAVDGAQKMLLLVISPTGQIILLMSRNPVNDISKSERPTDMALTQETNRTVVRYVGYTIDENGTRPTFGSATPAIGAVKPFEGFGELVEEAAANVSGDPTGNGNDGEQQEGFVMNKNTIIIICSAGVGGLALTALLAMAVVLYKSSEDRGAKDTERLANHTARREKGISSPTDVRHQSKEVIP